MKVSENLKLLQAAEIINILSFRIEARKKNSKEEFKKVSSNQEKFIYFENRTGRVTDFGIEKRLAFLY